MSGFTQITFLAPVEETEMRFFGYENFIERLKEASSAPVVLAQDDGTIPDVRGPILISRYGATVKQRGSANLDGVISVFREVWPESTRHQLFCLNADRGAEALTLLDALGLAGSVDLHDYRVGLDPIAWAKARTINPACTACATRSPPSAAASSLNSADIARRRARRSRIYRRCWSPTSTPTGRSAS